MGVTEESAVVSGNTVADLLSRARAAVTAGDAADLARSVGRVSDLSSALPAWMNAGRLLADADPARWARREVRVAVIGSHTTGHLTSVLPVAMARHAVAVTTYESPYGQYEQEILDPGSGLYAFAPDLVLLLIDERELRFPQISTDPATVLAAETRRWRSLWSVLRERTGASLIQATFVPRGDDGLGHLALSMPGSRRRLVRALNLELGEHLPAGVHLLDAELVAASIGTGTWSDDRFWFLAKQAVGLGALPALSRELARITAAAIGLTRKVIVLDLDNTLWGGVIGEDGLGGIVIGNGAQGEAYQAFQEQLLTLRRRGVLLAVVSKNNDADARRPFLAHPDMVLALSDFVAFRASWDDKSTVIRQLGEDLSLGLDSFVFVDDNPFEREAVRLALPDVDIVDLPPDPSGYPAALARHPTLEPGALTGEDTVRTDQYRALAQAGDARASATTAEEFLAGLEMHASVEPVGAETLPRVVQLIGKTNQFNLTGRRHNEAAVEDITGREDSVHLTLRLRDRFTDHGLVGVLLAVAEGPDLRVDTWLMSCRVLGRGLEIATLRTLTDLARDRGFTRVLGEYLPTGRNEPARGAYERSGFTADLSDIESAPGDGEPTKWVFDLAHDSVPDPGHIITKTINLP